MNEIFADLLKRLKAAEIGEWALDSEVATAIGCTKAPQTNPYNSFRVLHPNGRTMALPAYTTSIDVALTLVPEGWSWRTGNIPSGRGFADLGTQKSLQCIEAATPALALCIAALCAREAMKEK